MKNKAPIRLAIPFFRQKTDYTCGPACLRMIFAYFGKQLSEKALTPLAKTTPQFGSPHTAMIKAARLSGFRASEKRRAKLGDIEKCLQEKLPVIVNYLEPIENEIHYAVIVGITKDDIIMHDPEGKKYALMPKKAFVASWRNRHHSYRWMLVIRKKS